MCTLILTWPAVGNFTMSPVVRDPVPSGDEPISLFTTLVAAFLSAVVGGDVSGRARICPTVSFEGENVCISCVHPNSMCFRRFFSATTSVHPILSYVTSRSPSTFITTSVASGNDVVFISCVSLQEGHG